MEKSGSQKVLKVVSILDIISAVLMFLMAIVGIVGSAGVASLNTADLADSGLTAGDQTAGVALFGIIAAVMFVIGILELIEGILGIRAANDPSKIMPVWVIAIISLAGSVISLVMGAFNVAGMTLSISSVLAVALDGLMFWVANNIKNQNVEA